MTAQVTTILIIFSFIGILDTSYLIRKGLQKKDVWCPFFPDRWCRTVQHSKQSKMFFGIPNSVLGFCMYLAILMLTIVSRYGIFDTFFLLQLVVGFGFLFSVYFLYVQGFVLRAFCTWCVVSAINFIVMTYAVFLL